jgi:hypothetical protein
MKPMPTVLSWRAAATAARPTRVMKVKAIIHQ